MPNYVDNAKFMALLDSIDPRLRPLDGEPSRKYYLDRIKTVEILLRVTKSYPTNPLFIKARSVHQELNSRYTEFRETHKPEMTNEEHLNQVQQIMDTTKDVDGALDYIYDYVKSQINFGHLKETEELLQMIVDRNFMYNFDIHLGYLTATLPARYRLKNRKTHLEWVQKMFRKQIDHEPGVLRGLE